MTVPGTKTGRERAGSGPGRADRRGTRGAGGGIGAGAVAGGRIWLVAGVFVLFFFAAAAPSPLYGVYQAQWRFSAATLTAVFAVYALALLVALLVFGSVSDYLGRRRVILASLVVAAGACGLFLAAHGVGMLFAARALQGAAVGTATSALGAALIDLQPEGSAIAPVITIAAGQLGLAAGGLDQRAGPGGAGAHPAGLVAAARRQLGRRRRGAGDAGDRTAPPRGAGRAATPGGGAAAGPGDVRRGSAVPDRGVDAQRVLPVAGAVAGRAGGRLAGPALGRAGDLPGRRDPGGRPGRVPRRRRRRPCWPAAWPCSPAPC